MRKTSTRHKKERATILTVILKLPDTETSCWSHTRSNFSVHFWWCRRRHTAVSAQAESRLASLAHSGSICVMTRVCVGGLLPQNSRLPPSLSAEVAWSVFLFLHLLYSSLLFRLFISSTFFSLLQTLNVPLITFVNITLLNTVLIILSVEGAICKISRN